MIEEKWTRRKTRILLLVLLVILIIVGLIVYFTSYRFKLKIHGYDRFETNLILNNTKSKDIETILKYDYMNQLSAIIDVDTYESKNMTKYIKYYQKNKKVPVYGIVSIVNANAEEYEYTKTLVGIVTDKEYKQKNLDKYITYYNKYNDALPGDIVYLVNHDIDKEYTKILSDIINAKYYLLDRFNRYIEYANKNQDLKAEDIVARVNCNRDYNDYTNVMKADSNKKELVLVNKYYKLDEYTINRNFLNFVDVDEKYSVGNSLKMEKEAYQNFIEMSDKAKQSGLTLLINNAYVSSSSQQSSYNKAASENGESYANSNIAKGGHSELQTGYSLTISNNSNSNFRDSNEYKWLLQHASEYGFILRYPEGKQSLTGFDFNPSQFKYVGRKIANEIKKLDITYDEYYAYYVSEE